MSKRSKPFILATMVAVPLALGACSPEQPQGSKRDSYANLDDCMKEWPVTACNQAVNPETGDLVWAGPPYKDNKPTTQNEQGQVVERKSSPGVAYMPLFFPHNNVAPSYNAPAPQNAVRPFVVPPIGTGTSSAATAPRPSVPSVSAPSVASRGGFGATSSSVGAASSGG